MSSKKYYINNDVEVEELAAKLSKTIILDRDDENNIKKAETTPLFPPRICDVKSFDDQIGQICQSLFHTLTSKQLEATYQRCLAIDLQHAGIEVLAQEREIKLQYKGRDVGTRRADIVLQTPLDKQWVVLELKALQNLTSEHMKQLEFYMYHFEIDIGYLINFPTDRGFPDLPSNAATYRQTILSGGGIMLSDRNIRARHANAQVQIIKVERVITNEQSQSAQIVTDATPVLSSAQSSLFAPYLGRTTSDTFVVPIAKTTGEPCKVCTRNQSYCRNHKPNYKY